jgi:hypothetical protein
MHASGFRIQLLFILITQLSLLEKMKTLPNQTRNKISLVLGTFVLF